MSKNWYPVIDYEKCTECGVCTRKCKNGVYDQNEASTPVVIAPNNCVQGCHGCENLCTTKAISYVGDKGKRSGDCGCSCGGNNGGCC